MGRGSKHNLHHDFIRNPAPMLEARQGAAYTGENMTSPESPAILYEHADGRRAVVSANRVATFAIDNPDWHRAGPVEIVWVDDPIRRPKNAKEVREFFNSDFISAQFAAEDYEPSPMAKVAAALRQKAEQEDAAYQARRSDQGLMESEWGPMEDAPPHEDPPMHVAVVEGDDTVRTLQWNRDVAAFAYPAGTLLYAARSQAKEGVA